MGLDTPAIMSLSSLTYQEGRTMSNQTIQPRTPKLTNLNDLRVMQVLTQTGSMTRGMLMEKTGIPRTTLYDSLTRLRLRGLVVSYSETPTRPGRPKVFFHTSRETALGEGHGHADTQIGGQIHGSEH